MQLRPGIEVSDDVLDEFAHRHAIKTLAAFGSVLRPDFGPASDSDLLVEFDGIGLCTTTSTSTSMSCGRPCTTCPRCWR